MQRFRSLAAVIVMAGGAFASGSPDSTTSAGGTPVDSSAVMLPDSLVLAHAATFDDTLAVLARSLRAFEVIQKAMPGDGVFEELVAAVRESYTAGDIEAAAILSDDAWEFVRARRR